MRTFKNKTNLQLRTFKNKTNNAANNSSTQHFPEALGGNHNPWVESARITVQFTSQKYSLKLNNVGALQAVKT